MFEDARGSGLMLGLKCRMPNGTGATALRAEHLLCVPAGDNVIRLLPPLTTTDDEIRIALDRIRSGAKALSSASEIAPA